MADLPADITETSEQGTTFWQRLSWPEGHWVVVSSIVLGTAAFLLEVFDVHALGYAGALSGVGLLVVATGVLYGLAVARRNTMDLSRTPFAANDALTALPDPCYLTDKRGVVLFANAAYRNLVAAIDGERAASLERMMAGKPDAEETLFRLSQAARTGFAADEELRFAPRPGAVERIYKVVVRPLSGELGGSVWLMRDLTMERERVEVAERESGRLLSYLDHVPVGFFATGANGEIDYMNATLADWLGVTPAQATERAMTLADFAVGDLAALAPAGEAGESVQSLDVDLTGAEGQMMPVRITQTLMPSRTGGAPITCALVLNRATAEKAEETVRDAEMRFARFFNHAPIGIATVLPDGRIENANSAFLTYVGEGVERGMQLADLVVEEDRAAMAESLARARDGQVSGAAVDIHLVQRNERVAQLYASRLDTGDDSAVVVYLIDATEQKSLEMQFAQSQKMQAVGQLAGGVAHDFNNLLTAIIGFCDLLLSRHQAGDPSFADVMQIKQNANRAANLTRQLLAFSRRQTLRPKVLSLTDAIAELQNLLSRLLTEKVELKIVHGRDLGLVKVDQNQLEQVIVNLAVNARDAMPDGGRVTIRTANVSEADSRALDHALMPPAEYLLIEVSDTGTGIAKENLGKIFEPFFTTKDPSKGTGLGLSTVYGIVKQTGGFIFPYSAIGKGTSFRIYLPRYFETPTEARENAEAKIAAAAPETADLTGKGTILLVEDEDAVRTFAARALSTRGYDVLQAESGEVALDVVRNHKGRIDLVVSDVVMPNMDGPTMAKELRHMLPGTKIIFVSGYAEDAFAKSLDPEQDFHFLPKPFSLKQLAAAVKDVMGTKAAD
ncbi:MAG: PAS domain-containing protein [Rhizobiales bacterium]|nr:PAS domain-containing protein [Hyphomicrobiales bacterium]